MRPARLLEEKLDRKREAAEAYEAVAAANPGTRAGREAAGASRRLLGEMQQTDREEYYDRTYGVTERDPYRITQEELNGPAMRRMRAQGFDLRHYDLAVDLHPRDSRIDVEARISGRLAAPLAEPLLLQLNPALDVESVEIGGAAARNLRRGPHIEIVLPDGAEGDLDLTVRYGGKVGMWFDDRLTTEGASLRSEARWVPQSHFGDMFTQAVTIEAPQNYRAISQGAEQADSGRAASNPARRVWSYRQDKPSQFTTIALGRYERLAFEGPRGLAMEVDLLPEHKDQLDAYRRAMLQSVETFEAIYGAFPFERLAVAEVPDFPGGYGAASLVLVGSIAFPENGAPVKFLAHEIAHQWWGNRVSLDLTEGSIPWLSEAFATYSDAVFTERTVGADAFLSQVLAMGNFYRENILLFEDRPIAETLWSHPMYRSLMYEKGALVIHSLRREMGDEPFFTALRRFLEEHPYQVVKVESLARIASDVAGRDLGWFFDEQLGRAGYARVRIENATAAEQAGAWTVELQLSQQDPAYRMAMDVEIETEDGPQRAEIVAEGAASTHQLGVRARPIRVRLDPDHWRLIDPRSEFVERTVTPRPGGCIPRIRGKDGDLM
jgi:aminopeptidase N